MSLTDSYRGRRAFVTGHTGFKGAWLAEWLTTLGADVTGYALDPPTEPNLFELLALASELRHVVGDIRDLGRLTAEMRAAQPSIVFHLAAMAIVRRAYAEPRDTFETNIMGTVNVLEAARACPSVQAVVVISSDKCYENNETGRPFRETDAMGGRDAYSASKGCTELVTAAYRDSFFANGAAVATARAGNVIGGGDWAVDRIIPDCVRAMALDQPIVVRNPDAVRPWQHVLEPLSGYLHLGASLLHDGRRHAEAWNFGPTDDAGERPVRWVVERFIDEWGSGTWVTPADATTKHFHEALRLSLDSSKARERLGWAPVWAPEVAVRRTAAWYHEYYRAPARARELVADQLRTYQADARAAGLSWATANGEATS